MSKFLVVGGAGYIGSHLVHLLCQNGHDVHVLDNFQTGHRESIIDDQVAIHILDAQKGLPSGEVYYRGGKAHGGSLVNDFDGIYYLASNAYVEEGQISPVLYLQNNVSRFIDFIGACHEQVGHLPIPPIVYASSYVSKYPQSSMYARSKEMCEKILRDMIKLEVVRGGTALRLSNVGGSYVDGRLGEWHDPETHLIPNAIDAINKDRELVVWDKFAIRDYVHVLDVCNSFVEAMDRNMNITHFDVYGVGRGVGLRTDHVLQEIERIKGAKIRRSDEFRPRRGDVPELVGDVLPSRARGFHDLEHIIRSCETGLAWRDRMIAKRGSDAAAAT